MMVIQDVLIQVNRLGQLEMLLKFEALESGMCDVIEIRLKRKVETRSWKRNQPINIKTAVEWPILKLRLPNFRWSYYFYFTSRYITPFKTFSYDVTHATFQCFLTLRGILRFRDFSLLHISLFFLSLSLL